jgi:hypothetical protein
LIAEVKLAVGDVDGSEQPLVTSGTEVFEYQFPPTLLDPFSFAFGEGRLRRRFYFFTHSYLEVETVQPFTW